MEAHHFHAVIWIDHHEAKIFHFNARDAENQTLHSQNPSKHIHHKANTIGSGHASMEPAFLKKIVSAVSTAGEILVIGPGNAKLEFTAHVEKHDPKLKVKILGVETVDHPSDGEIVAYARTFFKAADSMLPQ